MNLWTQVDYENWSWKNASAKDYLETNHNFDFKDSKMFIDIHNKEGRKMESNIIFNYN